jgi:hypothetical protein
MRRHARPCAGHPRLTRRRSKDVDGRDEPGHDGEGEITPSAVMGASASLWKFSLGLGQEQNRSGGHMKHVGD